MDFPRDTLTRETLGKPRGQMGFPREIVPPPIVGMPHPLRLLQARPGVSEGRRSHVGAAVEVKLHTGTAPNPNITSAQA